MRCGGLRLVCLPLTAPGIGTGKGCCSLCHIYGYAVQADQSLLHDGYSAQTNHECCACSAMRVSDISEFDKAVFVQLHRLTVLLQGFQACQPLQ